MSAPGRNTTTPMPAFCTAVAFTASSDNGRATNGNAKANDKRFSRHVSIIHSPMRLLSARFACSPKRFGKEGRSFSPAVPRFRNFAKSIPRARSSSAIRAVAVRPRKTSRAFSPASAVVASPRSAPCASQPTGGSIVSSIASGAEILPKAASNASCARDLSSSLSSGEIKSPCGIG